MLCLQQCIDLCDFTPEEVQAIGENAGLQDILAMRAACPRQVAEAPVTDAGDECRLRDLRNRIGG